MKFWKSFSVRLSLRFMFLLTMAIIILSFVILFFVRSLVLSSQTLNLKTAEEKIFSATENFFLLQDSKEIFNQTSEKKYTEDFDQNFIQNLAHSSKQDSANFQNTLSELPYYLTYLIWEKESQKVIATNDPFLPLLNSTSGKACRYIVKDFFFDGDLDILYYATEHTIQEKKIIIAVAMNMDNNTSQELFSKLPHALLLMIIPILILSFFVSLFITKNTITPVVKITKAAKNLTTERLDELLPLTGRKDEIDQLSEAFNELFARIKKDFDRERQFSSDVSHELNTPLTVISGQANLLLRWGKENPKQLEKSLNAIKNEANSMNAIIQNLLHISRVESGRIKPEKSEISLNELFGRIEEETLSINENVSFECSAMDYTLYTDLEMLHEILTVLVSNSIKFSTSSDECKIKLCASKNEKGLIISESDNGNGISEDALPHVFERFYRADESRTRAVAGSGLGLSIAKTLCDALGAEIFAENIRPFGVKFSIKF